MCCIWTRTTGRTSPNTRPPSRGSNNSLDCHCAGKGRSDENLSNRVLAGVDWKHRACGRPRWVVASLSDCEADDKCGKQAIEFWRAGFYGQVDGRAACIDRSASGSDANLTPTVAEYWGKDREGRTEIGRRPDSHHRQCRCGRKATGLRPSAVLRLYPESLCRCHLSIRS